MKNFILTASILIYAPVASSQDVHADIFQQYKNENAVVLLNKEHLEINLHKGDLSATSKTEQEILLLSDLAPGIYNQASVQHSYFNKLASLDAYALIPDRKGYRKLKMKETKTVKSTTAGIFYDDVHETVVTYAGLEKGAKTVLTYELEHRDPHFLPAFQFHTGLPVVHSEFKVTVPKDVELGWQIQGSNDAAIKPTIEESRGKLVYTWTARDLPRVKIYSNAPNPSYYLPHLLVYVKSYKVPGQKEPAKIFGSVDELYKFYSSFVRNLNQAPSPELSDLVKKITAGLTSEKEKAKAIYQWVQQNIKYVAFEDGMGGFIPRQAPLVYQRRYGDCKDMSSLLVAMYREAGIEAYYTWIGTRHKPYRYEKTPLPIADNHMICTIRIGDEWIFTDGTDALIPFGFPPSAIQGKEALVGLDRNNYKIIDVPVMDAAKNLFYDSTKLSISGRGLTGSAYLKWTGYGAWSLQDAMRYKNEKEKADAMKSLFARGSNKFTQTDFDFAVTDDDAKELTASAGFKLDDYAQRAGKEVYLNMNLQRTFEDFIIEDAERTVPIETNFRKKITEVVVLEIPSGYKVNYLPPAAKHNVENLWGFTMDYTQKGNEVHLRKEITLNTLYIQPSRFSEHKKLVNELKNQYKESIVLTTE